MKVLIVCDVLGEENNGTTVAAMNLIRFLKSRGHDVRVLCADDSRRGEKGYYVVDNLHFGKLIDRYVAKVGVSLAKPVRDVIESALDGVDAVHVMLPFALGVAAAKYAKERGLPVTAGFHCQAENITSYIKVNKSKLINRLVYKVIYHKLYKHVDAIHYPTEFIKRTFEQNIGKTTCGYVISNGVNKRVYKRAVEKPTELKDRFIITTTGRYAREKSQDTLIKAVAKSKYKDKIAVILAGQGVKEKYYRKLAEKLGVFTEFKFFDRDEIVDVINYSDMYVHPAEMELEGIACLEAIACGKLVIVSDSKLSATKEFAVDDKCVFKNRDPKDLARVIDYFMSNKELIDEYGEKYLKSAHVYDQEACMEKMEEMIKEVCSRVQKKKG